MHISRAASAAWAVAIAAARIRVELLRKFPYKRDPVPMEKAQSELKAALDGAALLTLSMNSASSRLDDATWTRNKGANCIGNLTQLKTQTRNPARFSLAMTWMRATENAEDAALRWVAAADVARDPAPAQLAGAVAEAAAAVASAALTAAVDAARLRVEFTRAKHKQSFQSDVLEAKRGLFTAEYRLAVANPSAAAAESRLAGATAETTLSRAALQSAQRAGNQLLRALAKSWVEAADVALGATEKWDAAV